MKILIILALVLAVLGAVGWKFSRFGYESAKYTVIEQDGSFEIREYPELTLVSTKSGDSDDAFMKLFRYIAKDNAEEKKIAMTTPVFMSSGETETMSFVVPEEVATAGAPAPKSPDVKLRSEKIGRVAVYRYSGGWKKSLRDEAREKLTDWVEKRGLKSTGEYFSAGYDPPFTPAFMRRNEALVRLAE